MFEPRLVVESLVAGYKPGFPILHEPSLCVGGGEVVTLIGPNGAGKSTLVKAVAGLVWIGAGSVTIGGANATGIAPHRLADFDTAFVPQTANIFQGLTIAQNLVLASRRIRMKSGRAAAMDKMFDLFPLLADRRTERAGGLSGGQRQLLAMAMALVAEPQLVLMDEPTASLSPKAAQEVLALVKRIASRGVSVLLVEQNARAALSISDRAYVLADGTVQHEGTGAELLTDPRVGEIYLGARGQSAA